MKKLIAASLLLASYHAPAQTLFHFGKDSVTGTEFLRAWQKNNTGAKSDQAFLDYLDLYINSRLKIEEAREKGYDTLPQMVADLENLRQQILPSYIVDRETVNRLVDEAFSRSQKDLHLAHIFIAARGSADTTEAKKKIAGIEAALKNGTAFESLAKEYSDDPAAKINGGDLGFITAFTLPYELENLAYNTPAGKVSPVYRSKAGYHMFKKLGERKAIGRMKASEILLAFPPGSTEASKADIKRLADSLYNRLLKGDDFGKLATQFSNESVSAASKGEMPEFGTGQYDAVFEKTVFALPADGAITKPFLTNYGYHIVKRTAKIPVPSKKTEEVLAQLRERVESGDRMNSTRSQLAKKIMQETGFRKAVFNSAELWAYSDSLLNAQPLKMAVHITTDTPLFSFRDKTYTASDWITYSQTFRYKPDGSGIKPYQQVWDEFLEASALDYYQSHLEKYNEEFRQQINEFRDGNLFFEIMQNKVWGPAQTDSLALLSYFEKNRQKYNWKQSAEAVIFYAPDAATAKNFAASIKKNPANWRELVSDMSEKIAADSSRFELEQLPNPTRLSLKAGTITAPLVNKADNTASFAYIVKLHAETTPRNFAEARGLVITDYQNELEKNWIAELRKKYPVTINEKVLNELKAKK